MKVAIIADPLDNQNAGVHVYTRNMINALIQNNPGWEIILIRQKKVDNIKGVKQIAIRNISLPIGFASFRLFVLIPYILRKEKVDVVIEPAHFGPFNLSKSIKRVTIIHDLTPLIFPQFHKFHSQLLQRLFLRRILRKADLIVSNSTHTRNDIIQYFPFCKDKTVRIYPGIENPVNHESASPPLGEIFESPYFLIVGTIEPRKNHLLLLKAFEKFKESDNDQINLVICGSKGWKSEPFFKALGESPVKNFVHLTGFVSNNELHDLYLNSIALIYPSVYEGFGLPVGEAIKAGTIPIITHSSSLPEVGGPHAFYLKKEDYVELADLMEVVSKMTDADRRERIISLQLHVNQFNWDDFAKTFWQELQALF